MKRNPIKFNGIFGENPPVVVSQYPVHAACPGAVAVIVLHGCMYSPCGRTSYPALRKGDIINIFDHEKLLYIDRVDRKTDYTHVIWVIPFHKDYVVDIPAGLEMPFIKRKELKVRDGGRYRYLNLEKGLVLKP